MEITKLLLMQLTNSWTLIIYQRFNNDAILCAQSACWYQRDNFVFVFACDNFQVRIIQISDV